MGSAAVIVAAAFAWVLRWALTKKDFFKKFTISEKLQPWLLFIVMGGYLAGANLLLGVFGGSIVGIYRHIVNGIAGLVGGTAGTVIVFVAGAIVGVLAVKHLINLCHDTFMWKAMVDKGTEKSAIILAICLVIGIGGVAGRMADKVKDEGTRQMATTAVKIWGQN